MIFQGLFYLALAVFVIWLALRLTKPRDAVKKSKYSHDVKEVLRDLRKKEADLTALKEMKTAKEDSEEINKRILEVQQEILRIQQQGKETKE